MEQEEKFTKFNEIDWAQCLKSVARLQHKIVVAYEDKQFRLVKNLQNVLVNSFAARALAVKRVISNSGAKTPGIDKEIWNTEASRSQAIIKLKDLKNYSPKPLRRVYIPKPDTTSTGSKRPLSIPTLFDRAMQALHLMALDPIAEVLADKHSYGFRPYRSPNDALQACYIILGNKERARYVLDADIKKFFDRINHDYILKTIPMDKRLLKAWLKAGYFEAEQLHDTDSGVPQGGIISPTIANMVLNGLSAAIEESVKHLKTKKFSPKVNTIRYADDFIVTGATEEILKENVLPKIKGFLEERGLELNMEKTKIVEITEGFDFLGFNFRKYKDLKRTSGEVMLIKPSEKSLQKIRSKIKGIFRDNKKVTAYILISTLNPVLRGWANYFSSSVAKRAYTKINMYLFYKLLQWVKRKHLELGVREAVKRNFQRKGTRGWIFTGTTAEGKPVDLFDITSVKIKRHIKVKDFNPYLLENAEYYKDRVKKEYKKNIEFNPYQLKVLSKTQGMCKVCNLPIFPQEDAEIHHIKSKRLGGSDSIANLLMLHKSCHNLVTYNRRADLKAKMILSGIIAE